MDYNTPGAHPHELAYTGLPLEAVILAAALLLLLGFTLSLLAAAGRGDEGQR